MGKQNTLKFSFFTVVRNGKTNSVFRDFSAVPGCSGVFRGVPGCSGDVPVFWGVPVFRCSGVPGFSTCRY